MSRSPLPEPDFLNSVLGTKFRDLNDSYISECGNPWPGGKKIAIVTAWNPNFKTAPKSKNTRANALLNKRLAERGKTFRVINAWWPDGSAFEESFVVEGLTHGEARELCRDFRQGGYFYANRNSAIRTVFVNSAN